MKSSRRKSSAKGKLEANSNAVKPRAAAAPERAKAKSGEDEGRYLPDDQSLAVLFLNEMLEERVGDVITVSAKRDAWVALATWLSAAAYPPRTKSGFNRDSVMRVLGCRDGFLHALVLVEHVMSRYHGPYSGNFPETQTRKIRERDAILAPLKEIAADFDKSMRDCLKVYKSNNSELETITRTDIGAERDVPTSAPENGRCRVVAVVKNEYGRTVKSREWSAQDETNLSDTRAWLLRNFLDAMEDMEHRELRATWHAYHPDGRLSAGEMTGRNGKIENRWGLIDA
jgi:hypothetical protein